MGVRLTGDRFYASLGRRQIVATDTEKSLHMKLHHIRIFHKKYIIYTSSRRMRDFVYIFNNAIEVSD